VKLTDEQAIFTLNAAKLILYIYQKGNKCTLGEAFRPRETAELYSKEGIGIKNSLHTDRLAVDLNLFTASGEYLTDGLHYAPFGAYWKTLSPYNKWGGDFKSSQESSKSVVIGDYNHFEMVKEKK
jgi:hypothetical protein